MYRLLFVFTLLLLITGLSEAQSDPLKAEEARRQIMIQKVEAEIKAAFAEAARLQQSGQGIKAAERLRRTLFAIDDPILPDANKKIWRAQLLEGIRLAEKGEKPALADPKGAIGNDPKAAELARVKAAADEAAEIKRGIDTMNALIRAGEDKQAKKEIDALLAKYPTSPTVLVLPDLLNKRITIDEVRQMQAEQVDRIRKTMVGLDKSAVLPKEEMEFDPKRWKEITEKRKPQLDPKLKAILVALDTPVSLKLKDAAFEEIIKSISDSIKQPILLEKASLQEAMVESSTPSSIDTRGPVSARTALRAALEQYGLAYIIKNNTIQVVTKERAATMMETRVYYIGDLVRTAPAFPDPRFALLDQQQLRDNVNAIIDTIKKSTDASSWKDAGLGGKGEITFHWPSMSIIVRQSAEVHGLLGKQFYK
ncbi:MAG: hypothetical protein N2112_05020 [Gemmataceae bacterium]|jgi:hypothetical protein|nr:hypothetical protein [Gemmataceae bacterium]